MPKIEYIPKDFSDATMSIIYDAQEIMDEYSGEGLTLTLRQLYYQFVARDILPNTQQQYNRLGRIVTDARLAGHLDWEGIEDRTRGMRELPHWVSGSEILNAAARGFNVNKWRDQPHYVEVWIEKEALAGILEKACTPLDVPWFSCRGYVSASAMWEAAQRIMRRSCPDRQPPVIIHLGDHDPSGLDMTRDIFDRLDLFFSHEEQPAPTVNRIALNFEQIEEFGPPPNPAKLTDSRAHEYIKRYGRSSWELDALNPRTLVDLITVTIEQYMDRADFEEREAFEQEEKTRLLKVARDWNA